MKILDSDKKYFYPDEAPLNEWFNEFNERFFEGKLPPVELEVIWGAKNTLGGFRRPERKVDDPFRPEDCAIVFNCRFFESEDDWRNTMVHEMVHYYVYMVMAPVSNHTAKYLRLLPNVLMPHQNLR